MKYEFKGTPGEWSLPHLCDDRTTCNCPWVLSEQYFGSVATINHSKPGEHWRAGDNPPTEEAIHNGALIAAAPDLLMAAIDYLEEYEFAHPGHYSPVQEAIKKAVHKALSITD